jgi:hypothetical protein
MSWLDKVYRWFRLVLDLRRSYVAIKVDELPELLEKGVFYLVGESAEPWAAFFLCPCGCGDSISLSLIPTDSPRWRIMEHRDGSFSLIPSVWRIRGCRSHFVIRKGRVYWAKFIRT